MTANTNDDIVPEAIGAGGYVRQRVPVRARKFDLLSSQRIEASTRFDSASAGRAEFDRSCPQKKGPWAAPEQRSTGADELNHPGQPHLDPATAGQRLLRGPATGVRLSEARTSPPSALTVHLWRRADAAATAEAASAPAQDGPHADSEEEPGDP